MKRKTEPARSRSMPPGSAVTPAPLRPRRSFARWRALSLSLVYVIFAVHFIHWKIKGTTLAPLELNEVMYTLELGIVTAGFLFMCLLVVGTLVFGRFFCSWACHIMVLQDLCAWLLRKLGIRRKPIRSRLLLLVPPFTAFYMFVWPQILRAWEAKSFPTFRLATDRAGWASFVTNHFWRNLPGPAVIILTFLLCGFVIVYLLGSRTFCTYVCPYGAIFGLADRFAPGRIRVTDACRQCGTCTAACTTGVRVHDEVREHGMIVNPACLKDLDCVSACPQRALHYKFGWPSLLRSYRSGGRFGRLPYDFSIGEEILLASVFVVVLCTFRGLYGRVPFLLSLGLGGIISYLAVIGWRCLARGDVILATLPLKRLGRYTTSGRVFAAFSMILAVFVAHSAYVRYGEYRGLRQARALFDAEHVADADGLAASALAHLSTADRWGLLGNVRVEQSLVEVAFRSQRFAEAGDYAARVLQRHPNDVRVRLRLGQALARQGKSAEAERHLRAIVSQGRNLEAAASPVMAIASRELGGLLVQQRRFAEAADAIRRALAHDPDNAAAHGELGGVLAELGRFDEAIASLQESVRLDPRMGGVHYNLGAVLARLGRFDEAIPCYERAIDAGLQDADLYNNLGFALMRVGRYEEAGPRLEQALALNRNHADAHFNLGTVFAKHRQIDRANDHFRAAARVDPRYAQLINNDAAR